MFRADGFAANELDGHIAFQARVVGFVDGRHATLYKLLDDMVTPNGLPSKIWHGILLHIGCNLIHSITK
jgi:hypothetical protein